MLDVDVCGPSIPLVMGLEGEQVHNSGSGWSPVVCVYAFPLSSRQFPAHMLIIISMWKKIWE